MHPIDALSWIQHCILIGVSNATLQRRSATSPMMKILCLGVFCFEGTPFLWLGNEKKDSSSWVPIYSVELC